MIAGLVIIHGTPNVKLINLKVLYHTLMHVLGANIDKHIQTYIYEGFQCVVTAL